LSIEEVQFFFKGHKLALDQRRIQSYQVRR